MAAGNPNLPQFTLSPAQTANLPPIDPDIYQDSLLPTVRYYITDIVFMTLCNSYCL